MMGLDYNPPGQFSAQRTPSSSFIRFLCFFCGSSQQRPATALPRISQMTQNEHIKVFQTHLQQTSSAVFRGWTVLRHLPRPTTGRRLQDSLGHTPEAGAGGSPGQPMQAFSLTDGRRGSKPLVPPGTCSKTDHSVTNSSWIMPVTRAPRSSTKRLISVRTPKSGK